MTSQKIPKNSIILTVSRLGDPISPDIGGETP